MKSFHTPLLVLRLALAGVFGSLAQAAPAHSAWERSLVSIEVTSNEYDYHQPWSKQTESHRKTGVVVGPRQVLTTADDMADLTLVRLQKGGRDKWWNGHLDWIDYHANMALLTVAEPAFWSDLRPVRLADPVPTKGEVEVQRWREGGLEARKGDINRVTVKRGKLTIIDYLHLEITCEIKAADSAEAVTRGNRLAGLVVAQDGTMCTVLPSSFIQPILEAHRQAKYPGLGYFAFVWQRAQNPALHHLLKQEGEPQGVVVVETPARGGNQDVLKPRDVLLQVDGFDIDIQGDYIDPAYGKLQLENLSTRGHWAGDEVRLKIWRDGAVKEVRYRLPKADYSAELVPLSVFDQEPEYLVLGGMVFQPLTGPYLRAWGNEWRRRVPFRLAYYDQEKPTAQRPSVVILSMVLPDPYNLGYQDNRYLAVNQINGRRIATLADVSKALEQPRDGFHILEFDRGDSLNRLVLDAATAETATQRVLQRYGIQKDRVLSAPR